MKKKNIYQTDQYGWRHCAIFFVSLQSDMDNNDTLLETLKRLVCEGTGVQASSQTPADFQAIVAFIENRTHESIGLTTVKRVWQYGGLSAKHRPSTLHLLARAVGYRSYEDFCTHYGDCTPSSDIIPGGGIRVSDLLPGERLMLRWNPGREVVAEYLGNLTFRVTASVASKLAVGDTFQATWFATGHPAMLANVIHQENSWPLYEIGQQGGLTLVQHHTKK